MLSCQCRPESLRNVSSNLVESKTLNKAVLTSTSGPTGYQLGAPNQTNKIEHLSFAQMQDRLNISQSNISHIHFMVTVLVLTERFLLLQKPSNQIEITTGIKLLFLLKPLPQYKTTKAVIFVTIILVRTNFSLFYAKGTMIR